MASRFCDWRKKGLTPVRDQGECRSCWAFAAASNIEALWKIHRNVNYSISVQEIIDCTYQPIGGCLGGYVWDALQYVFNHSGLSSSTLYPYIGKNHTCQKYKRRKLAKIDGYSILPRNEKYIANIVATRGPVAALMNQKIIRHYQKGIIQRSKVSCDPNYLDHAVLIVGFGEGRENVTVVRPGVGGATSGNCHRFGEPMAIIATGSTEPVRTGKIRRGTWSGSYWIIQNSWGKDWGEEGYFRMNRNSNTCGIAQYATTANVEDLGGEKPAVCPR